MATVRGMTAERAEALFGETIVNAFLSGKNLVLRTRAGTDINVGQVKADLLDAWPVGAVYVSVIATSPATLFGGGTWVRFAKGKFLVSLDEADGTFDTAEETGGEKTHTLTTAEIPAHHHTYQGQHASTSVKSGSYDAAYNSFTEVGDVAGNTGDTGGAGAHNNLPPFSVVYMWKRTA